MSASTIGPRSALLASGCLLACFGAQAQITPGQVGDTLKKPIELQPVRPAPTVQTQPQEAPPASASSKTLTVQQFEFAGNTLFSGAELSALVKDYLNRPVTLLDVFEAADKVADFYVSKGYTLASVNVPPQKIELGTVRLLVSEGRIARISAEDNKLYTSEQITEQLGEIRPGTVYQGGALAERVRNLNTLPGLQAKAIVKPGERYGTSDLVIKTVEDPVSGSLIVDNFGRESIGEMRVSAFGQVNNPLKVGDQLQLLLLRSEEDLLRYGYFAYSLPVNFSGTRLTLSYGHAEFDVAGTAPVDGRNDSARLLLDHPLRITPNSRLNVSLGASRTEADSDFTGITFSDTSITLVEVGASYTYNHANLAVTQAVLNLSSNFDQLERSELATLPLGEHLNAGQRIRAELDIQHLRPLVKGFQLYGHFNGVYSPDPLSDITAYSLGGPNGIRGYPASEIRGDRGYFGQLGINFPVAIAGARVTPRIFADSGKVFTVDPGPADFHEKTLTSVGFGADLQYQRINAKVDWSFPREDRTSSDGEDDRVFGSLAVSF
ncbi:ShlB/FhaC/HecB family hemolysin secretion/activation protein [Solimonas sp. K1W22B-7]|uniref:ShlB/FhaC/HecB family hemolysin secretion/activation protein n=1 Tax=Solimonas sp. K1W22B-7 TaxID=2303331 RepID=UPI000E331A73|nr:ShlB/FhaC/HecB family hemolysin secretion/activation protein [Solimonas sp. K1W22B-7]AXQ29782.1 ShlB/FhaC/HecB family hemolysin secretion/activation protein [Solimonas sp. K1W22B-7]